MPLSPTEADLVEHLIEEGRAALGRDDRPQVRRCLEALQRTAPDAADVALLAADLAWVESGPRAAIPPLEHALRRHPHDAELHHALGCAWAELDEPGAHGRMTHHFLETLRLDALEDARRGLGSPEMHALIHDTARACLAALPEDLAARVANVPVILEARPHRGVVEEGFDPRALGLFEGPDDRGLLSEQVATRPTRVVLFTANLLASFADPDELARQVEITVLHELGHFFGLDEVGVDRLGLA